MELEETDAGFHTQLELVNDPSRRMPEADVDDEIPVRAQSTVLTPVGLPQATPVTATSEGGMRLDWTQP